MTVILYINLNPKYTSSIAHYNVRNAHWIAINVSHNSVEIESVVSNYDIYDTYDAENKNHAKLLVSIIEFDVTVDTVE